MFQKCLVMMFAAQQQDVVFIETVSNTSGRYHTIIHCIPLDETEAEIAPMVFKVGIENHYNNVYVTLY